MHKFTGEKSVQAGRDVIVETMTRERYDGATTNTVEVATRTVVRIQLLVVTLLVLLILGLTVAVVINQFKVSQNYEEILENRREIHDRANHFHPGQQPGIMVEGIDLEWMQNRQGGGSNPDRCPE